jgi:RyR domain
MSVFQLNWKDHLLLGFLGSLHRAPGARGGLIGAASIVAAGFFLGLWGWVEGKPSPPRGDEYFYWEQQIATTARLMTGGELGDDALPSWQFQWVPWTLPLLALWVATVVFLRNFPNPLRVWLTTHLSSFDCIYGAGPLALQLSQNHGERKVGVLAIAPDGDTEARYRAKRLPVIRATERARVEKAVAGNVVIAADDSDLSNAELSQDLFSAGSIRPRRILARINHLPLRTHLSESYGATQPASETRLILFSTVDLQARNCLRRYPLDRFKLAATPKDSHAVVVGFSEMGEAMMLALLKSSHFTHGRPLRVTVVDRDPQARRSEFQARFPEAFSHQLPGFEPDDRAGGGMPHELLKRFVVEGKEPTAIYVCLPTPSECVACGLALLKQYRLLGIHLPPIHILANTASPGFEDSLRALRFLDDGGMLRMNRAEIEIVDGELLLQERLDALAQCIHERYLADRLAQGGQIGDQPSYYPWSQLLEPFKEDNREQADHHWLKLRDIGCAVVPGAPGSFELTPEEVEALAMSEHCRWLASRKIRSWQYGEQRDDARRKHTDIVPWEDLPEKQREISRETIRRIPEYLGLMGNTVERSLFVRLMASESARPRPEALSSYRRGIQARYPGKRLALVSDLTTEAEREACGFFVQDGAADFVLLLQRPIYEIVAALEPPARASFTRLARGASRILAGVGGRDPATLPLPGASRQGHNRTLVLGEPIPSFSPVDRIADDGTVRWADEA